MKPNSSLNIPKVDFFSLYLQEKMDEGLTGFLKYIFSFLLKQQNQNKDVQILSTYFSFIADFSINSFVILINGTYFSEYFYKLKRIPIQNNNKFFRWKCRLIAVRILKKYIFILLQKLSKKKNKKWKKFLIVLQIFLNSIDCINTVFKIK